MRRLLTILMGIGLCFTVLGVTSVHAMERYVAGVHYKIVAPAPSRTPESQVLSFFSYACPHCNGLESQLDQWRQSLSPDVHFSRVPAQWNPYFIEVAKLFYTLETLGLADKHSQAIFDAIHKKNQSLRSEAEILRLMGSLGVDKETFQRTFQGTAVGKLMRKGKGMLAQYKIPGVPSFVINGRYFVNVNSAGSPQELFKVLNFLLEKH